jgi:hypothetical protein
MKGRVGAHVTATLIEAVAEIDAIVRARAILSVPRLPSPFLCDVSFVSCWPPPSTSSSNISATCTHARGMRPYLRRGNAHPQLMFMSMMRRSSPNCAVTKSMSALQQQMIHASISRSSFRSNNSYLECLSPIAGVDTSSAFLPPPFPSSSFP